MTSYAMERAAERIARLAWRGLDVLTFCREAEEAIVTVVPSSPMVVWDAVDPTTLLITASWDGDGGQAPHEVLVWEYFVDDVMKTADIARSPRGILTLSEATGGDPTRSGLYRRFLEPLGIEEVVEVSLRTPDGLAWGDLGLTRQAGEPTFSAEELSFLTAIAPHLARGIRRGLVVGEVTEPEGPHDPGMVVVTADGDVASLTPVADRWMAELPGRWESDGTPPPAVVAVAGQALRDRGAIHGAGEAAAARVRSRAGHWLVLHGAPMDGAGSRCAAVILQPAHPARITPLLMAAYGLTNREQDITWLVLRGESTARIAATLAVSPHTVQQHLKSIFDKTGVRSRRDLVGKVFFAHYEPRVRDNERRASVGKPIRGGSFPFASHLP